MAKNIILILNDATELTRGAHYGANEGFGPPRKRDEIC